MAVITKPAGTTVMPEYRAYKIGPDGHFFEAVPLVCADAAEAVEKAQRFVSSGTDVEHWKGVLKVAAFQNESHKSDGAITHKVPR